MADRIWVNLIFDRHEKYNRLFYQLLDDNDAYTIFVTDFMQLHEESLLKEDVAKRFKKLNPQIELNPDEICLNLYSNFLDISKYYSSKQKHKSNSAIEKTSLLIDVIDSNLTLKFQGYIAEEKGITIPYKWIFNLTECSHAKFGAYVTLPLLVASFECINIYNNYFEQTQIHDPKFVESQQALKNDALINPRALNQLLISKSDKRKVNTSPKKRIRSALNPQSLNDLFQQLKERIYSLIRLNKEKFRENKDKSYVQHSKLETKYAHKPKDHLISTIDPINSLVCAALHIERGKIALSECFINEKASEIYEIVWKQFSKPINIKLLDQNSIFNKNFLNNVEGGYVPKIEAEKNSNDMYVDNDDLEKENKKREKYLALQRKEMLKKLLEIEEERESLKSNIKKENTQKKFKL